jgi:hypothetical protein
VLSLITPEVEQQNQHTWCLSPSKRTVERLWGNPKVERVPLPPGLRYFPT